MDIKDWEKISNSFVGKRIQIEERSIARQELRKLFGKIVVQIGGNSDFPIISGALAPHKIQVAESNLEPNRHCHLVNAEFGNLPFGSESVDICVLQHSLEYCDSPHQVLREAVRILRPGGRLLVFGFNPRSLWRFRLKNGVFSQSKIGWWKGLLSERRIEDWFRLLQLEPECTRYSLYYLPLENNKIRRFFYKTEQAIQRSNWPVGGVYCIRARKERVQWIFQSQQMRFLNSVRATRGITKPAIGFKRRNTLRIVRKTEG